MSLKDNFYQAMKELMNNGGLVGSDLEEKAKGQSELDAYLETPAAAPGADAPPYQQRAAQPQMPQQPHAPQSPYVPRSPYAPQQSNASAEQEQARETEPRGQYGYEPAAATYGEPLRGSEGSGAVPYYRPSASYNTGGDYEAPSEMTVISKNTLVDGCIRSFANITIQGNVRGDVSITKDAFLSGKVIGAVKCSNMEMEGSSVQGDIVTKGRALLDSDSLLLGDLNAQYVDINGKIKGNLDISGKAEFRSDSVILGDINTAAITVMDGANIQGYINTTYLKDNAEKVFPGKISIGEEDFSAQEAAL